MNFTDLFIAYKFIDILTTAWNKTPAFKLGIIDDEGNVLIPRKELSTGEERKAYTLVHVIVWNLKRLIEKAPGGKSKIASFGAAAWLLHEPAPKRKLPGAESP